jgi:hypothetical protein
MTARIHKQPRHDHVARVMAERERLGLSSGSGLVLPVRRFPTPDAAPLLPMNPEIEARLA